MMGGPQYICQECKSDNIFVHQSWCKSMGAPTVPNIGMEDPSSGGGRPDILSEAHKIIYGDREKTYGAPDKNLLAIAGLWNEYIKDKYNTNAVALTADDVCLMMILLKVARLANQSTHRDSMVDLAGYAALMERVQNSRTPKGEK